MPLLQPMKQSFFYNYKLKTPFFPHKYIKIRKLSTIKWLLPDFYNKRRISNITPLEILLYYSKVNIYFILSIVIIIFILETIFYKRNFSTSLCNFSDSLNNFSLDADVSSARFALISTTVEI